MSAIIRNIASLFLVALMVLLAQISGYKEFIFPEVGTLCIGLWVVNKHVWRVQKWQIPVLYTFSAIVGLSIVRYLSCPLIVQMELGFLLVALTLMVFDASITPAISACLLPILMGTTSWIYPLVVLGATLILTVGQLLMEKLHIRNIPDADLRFSVSPNRVKILWRWLALMLILLPIMLVADYYGCKYVLVPPLIVTLVEFSNSASGFRQKPFLIWCILVVSAFIGSFWELVIYLPQTFCAIISVGLILILFKVLNRYFAPAVAIALVPLILPVDTVLMYPVYVAVGAAYFIVMAELCFSQRVRHIFHARR